MQSAAPVKRVFNNLASLPLRLYKGLYSQRSGSQAQCTWPTWGQRHAQWTIVKIDVSQIAVARASRQRQGSLLHLGAAILIVVNCILHIPGRIHILVVLASLPCSETDKLLSFRYRMPYSLVGSR